MSRYRRLSEELLSSVYATLPNASQRPLTVNEITRATGVTRLQVHSLLERLERRELVWKIGPLARPGKSGRAPFGYCRADTSGGSKLLRGAEAEVDQILRSDPRFCECAVALIDGYLEPLYCLAEWYPNRFTPFSHFYITWSFLNQTFVSVPGCYWPQRGDEDAFIVETFNNPQEPLDWLLTQGLSLLRKKMLPNGAPLPKSVAEYRPETAYQQTSTQQPLDRFDHVEVL